MDRDLRDMTLVIVLSIVGVAIIIWFAAHGGGPSKEAVGKWGGFDYMYSVWTSDEIPLQVV